MSAAHPDTVAIHHAGILVIACHENDLIFLRKPLEQPAAFLGTSWIHLRKRIIEDGDAAAIRIKMFENRQTKCQRNRFLCSFRQNIRGKNIILTDDGTAKVFTYGSQCQTVISKN